jgi:hypothetical protein
VGGVLLACRNIIGYEDALDLLSDGGAHAETDTGTSAPTIDAGSPFAPTSLRFPDGDLRKGNVDGRVTIGKAADESTITKYILYWGAGASTKLTQIAILPKTGGDVTFDLRAATPPGATALLAVAANEERELAATALMGPDNYVQYSDVAAASGSLTSFGGPSAVLDRVHDKLLIVTQGAASPLGFVLHTCALDGEPCSHVELPAGKDAGTNAPRWTALVDATSQRLFVVQGWDAPCCGPYLSGALSDCTIDGASCSYRAIGGLSLGTSFASVLDEQNGRLVLVWDQWDYNSLAYLGCPLEGDTCASATLAPGGSAVGAGPGHMPFSLVDPTDKNLLVVTMDGSNGSRPRLHRCNLDGSSCIHTDISAGQGANSGESPFAVLDSQNRKLLVVTTNGDNERRPGLFRCDVDGTDCTYADISAGQGINSGVSPVAVIDATNQKLLVVTTNGANGNRLALFRCNLDGTGCAYTDISAGQPAESGTSPSLVIDPEGQRVHVVTANKANQGRPALYSFSLW